MARTRILEHEEIEKMDQVDFDKYIMACHMDDIPKEQREFLIMIASSIVEKLREKGK